MTPGQVIRSRSGGICYYVEDDGSLRTIHRAEIHDDGSVRAPDEEQAKRISFLQAKYGEAK